MAPKDMSVALIAPSQTESERQPPFRLEPFGDADSVSSFLSVPRLRSAENDAGRFSPELDCEGDVVPDVAGSPISHVSRPPARTSDMAASGTTRTGTEWEQ
jgi:hypothetical protein